jgi:HSP20 family protein
MQQFRRRFDELFDRMWGDFLTPYEEGWGGQPMRGLDVQEGDKEVVVRADMPGFEDKEIDLHVADNMLTIKAEKQQKHDGEEHFRRFYHSFSLPAGADPDKIQASYHNGVLELHIPRPESARPKRIALQGTAGEQAGSRTGKETASRAKT